MTISQVNELGLPTLSQIDRIWGVQTNLNTARIYDEPWYYLSHAADSLLRGSVRNDGSISHREYCELLEHLEYWHANGPARLSGKLSTKNVEQGFKTLMGIAALWAKPVAERDALPKNVVADLRAHARIFQNDLHNASLREEIRRRKATEIDTLVAVVSNLPRMEVRDEIFG